MLIMLLCCSSSIWAYGINSSVFKQDNPDNIDKRKISEDKSIKNKSFEQLSKEYTPEEMKYIMRINENYGTTKENTDQGK